MTPDEIMYTAYEIGVKANIYLTFMQICSWIAFANSIVAFAYVAIDAYKASHKKPASKHLNERRK